MDLRKIKAHIEAVTEGEIDELEVESKEGTVRIRKNVRGEEGVAPYVVMSNNPSLPVQESNPTLSGSSEDVSGSDLAGVTGDPTSSSNEETDSDLSIITSPIVGTFYESPSPDAPAFIEVGDKVTSVQVLCIIEAMKLMNEIEAEYEGAIADILVNNSDPVEYNQPLFIIDPL